MKIDNLSLHQDLIELKQDELNHIKGGGNQDVFYEQFMRLLTNPNVQVSFREENDILRLQITYVEPGNSITNLIA